MDFDMLPTILIAKDQFDAEGNLKNNWCGSACCIAGAAVVLGQPELLNEVESHEDWRHSRYKIFQIWKQARALLGLTEREAELLFAPFDYYGEIEEGDVEGSTGDWPSDTRIPADWAAPTIRHFMATRKVDWTVTVPA